MCGHTEGKVHVHESESQNVKFTILKIIEPLDLRDIEQQFLISITLNELKIQNSLDISGCQNNHSKACGTHPDCFNHCGCYWMAFANMFYQTSCYPGFCFSRMESHYEMSFGVSYTGSRLHEVW